MKLTHLFYTGLLASTVIVSCQKEEKKQEQPLDFSSVKAELKLETEKEKYFDEIVTKYQKLIEESREAAKKSGKMDRVALGIKNEELTLQQAEEMAKVLTAEQMIVFNKFIEENTRKRPRYNDQLLTKIQQEVGLSEEQMKIINAANDAFEKSFHDAHDIYHGNNDLAKEYWEKFDAQRKAVIEKTLTPEQFAKFKELVKEVKFIPRKKK